MTTRNLVPRATGEGSLGTAAKKWGNIYADNITLQDGETLATKISSQNSRITTAEGTVTTLSSDVTSLYSSVDELSSGKVNKAGDTMTGALALAEGSTSATPATTDNSTKIATTAFVKSIVGNMVYNDNWINNTDLNTLSGNGAFWIGTGCTNAPANGFGYRLLLQFIKKSSDSAVQIYFSGGGGAGGVPTIYIRLCVSNVWGTWRTI